MIVETVTKQNRQAIASDRWHVVHGRYAGVPQGGSRFVRAIVSEHDSRAESVVAAKVLAARLTLESVNSAADRRDIVFVRRPNFKSLRFARTRKPRRR
jgi:hypothetical protein